jgi:hypothetical protein
MTMVPALLGALPIASLNSEDFTADEVAGGAADGGVASLTTAICAS